MFRQSRSSKFTLFTSLLIASSVTQAQACENAFEVFGAYESSSVGQQITQQVEAYCGSCGYTTHTVAHGESVLFQCLSDSAPGVTDIVGLVIPVNFSDASPAFSAAHLNKLERALNEEGYAEDGNKGSVKDFFAEVSAGTINITHKIADPISLSYSSTFKSAHDALQDAVDIYIENHNFNGLTLIQPTSDMPTIQSLMFVTTVNSGTTHGNYKWNFFKHVGDIRTNAYSHVGTGFQNLNNIFNPDAVRVSPIVHELGHSVFDWPDIYHPCLEWNSSGECIRGIEGPGEHGLMANGTAPDHVNPLPPNPYFRSNTWGNLTTIVPGASAQYLVEFNSNQNYKIINPNNSNEFLVIAANDNTTADYYAGLPAHGLMIWHFGVSGWGYNVNVVDPDKNRDFHAYLEQADGNFDLENVKSPGKTGYQHLWGQGNVGDASDSFTFNNVVFPSHAPNASWWDGTPYGFTIDSYVVSPTGIYFNVEASAAQPNPPELNCNVADFGIYGSNFGVNYATVTNPLTVSVSEWEIKLDLGGVTLHSLWSWGAAIKSVDGGVITLSGSGNLGANQTIGFGLGGQQSSGTPLKPTCQVTVIH